MSLFCICSARLLSDIKKCFEVSITEIYIYNDTSQNTFHVWFSALTLIVHFMLPAVCALDLIWSFVGVTECTRALLLFLGDTNTNKITVKKHLHKAFQKDLWIRPRTLNTIFPHDFDWSEKGCCLRRRSSLRLIFELAAMMRGRRHFKCIIISYNRMCTYRFTTSHSLFAVFRIIIFFDYF